MSRTLQDPSRPNAAVRLFPANLLLPNNDMFGGARHASRITALSLEFVAKPGEAHKVQAALPTGIQGAFAEVAGFAGGLVLIANHEARLVTVLTLWTGDDRLQRSSENLKWIRALLNPYVDRWLRVQTSSAHTAEAQPAPQVKAAANARTATELEENEMDAVFAA
jgi:hypothetical protein